MLQTETITIPSNTISPDEYDTYQCTLEPRFREMAREELREDESIRAHALSQLRDWISKHPHIRKCRTGWFRIV